MVLRTFETEAETKAYASGCADTLKAMAAALRESAEIATEKGLTGAAAVLSASAAMIGKQIRAAE